MLEVPSNSHNKSKYSKTTNGVEEKINCKDGFCSLPKHQEISKQDENDMNLFDPI